MEYDIELLKLKKTDKINTHACVSIFAIPRVTEWLIRDSLSPNGSLTRRKTWRVYAHLSGGWTLVFSVACFSQIDFINNIDI